MRPDVIGIPTKIADIEKDLGLNVKDIKDISKRMAVGEAKARRAKKKWLKQTYVWLFQLQKIPTVAYNSST